MDDLWRSRIRADAYSPPDPGHARSGVPAFLGKVTSTGSTLGVGKFCQVVPVSVTGTETDGSASTATAGPASVIALAIGPTAPATNDLVVVRRVDHRWVFDRQTVGGGPSTTPGFTTCCANSLPATLSMSFAFRSGTSSATYFHQVQNQTLTYYPTGSFPAYYPDPFTGLSGRYISPTFGPDDLGQTDYYSLICVTGQIFLAFGQAGNSPISCCLVNTTSCSPFLAGGQPLAIGGGGGHGSCFQAIQPPPGGGSVANYGTDPADIITIS